MTAIHLAAKYGHVEVLNVLREHTTFDVMSVKVC